MKTFVHKFSRTLSVRCEIGERPEKGASVRREIVWTGRFRKKFLREYCRWMLQVNQVLADEWQSPLRHCFRVGRSAWENWQFEPGQPPMLASYSTIGPSEPVEEETEHIFCE